MVQTLHAKSTREKIVICVLPGSRGLNLVRRGSRLAQQQHGDFSSVYVHMKDSPSAESHVALQEVAELTHSLGGTMVELLGFSVVTEIADYANTIQATILIMGQSFCSRFEEILHGSFINRLLQKTNSIDIFLVADSADDSPVRECPGVQD